jgi:hypothetical protein
MGSIRVIRAQLQAGAGRLPYGCRPERRYALTLSHKVREMLDGSN